jgi:DNA-binding protein
LAKKDLQLAPMHRIIKKAGADRVSDEAAKELRQVLEEVGVRIAREALDFTKHAHRKTVKAEDIQIAVRKLLKE